MSVFQIQRYQKRIVKYDNVILFNDSFQIEHLNKTPNWQLSDFP